MSYCVSWITAEVGMESVMGVTVDLLRRVSYTLYTAQYNGVSTEICHFLKWEERIQRNLYFSMIFSTPQCREVILQLSTEQRHWWEKYNWRIKDHMKRINVIFVLIMKYTPNRVAWRLRTKMRLWGLIMNLMTPCMYTFEQQRMDIQ